ncbi:MAG: BatA domain-containing protein [Pirellulaceae bacterium]
MGLLTPLYALAALAIAGPILFHLIRKKPKGQQTFSSLMFLRPSSPKLTQRSRIEDWLLLFLRTLAILLIAVAFARPYLRQESTLNINLEGRNVVLLVDTSASMRRDGVFGDTVGEVQKLLDSLSPGDTTSLYAIDRQLTAIVPMANDSSMDPLASQDAVRNSLSELSPTWHSTSLDTALISLAEQCNASDLKDQARGSTEIVLFSDLHRESGIEALQGFAWPKGIQLDVRPIHASDPGNAWASLMASEPQESDDATYRVRVQNSADARNSTLELAWAIKDQTLGRALAVQVPPGQVRVFPLRDKPLAADRIRINGDPWDQDNTLYIPKEEPIVRQIGYLGPANKPAEEDAGFFLNAAPLDSTSIQWKVKRFEPQELEQRLLRTENDDDRPFSAEGSPDVEGVLKSVVVDLDSDQTPLAVPLRRFASAGGSVIILLSKPDINGAADFLASLLEHTEESIQVGDSQGDDFALLSGINYKSATFAPFADPRFNDFSKIRIWNHRRVVLPDADDLDVVAKLDDDSPLLIQQTVGDGKISVLTCGWQPSSSGLALSSKFIPILNSLVDPRATARNPLAVRFVGDSYPEGTSELEVISSPESLDASGTTRDPIFESPGLYSATIDGVSKTIAVQIPTSESMVVPVDPSIFEQFGVQLGTVESDVDRTETARQLQVEELERKQRFWQWCILAAVLVLILESAIAAWKAKTMGRTSSAELANS